MTRLKENALYISIPRPDANGTGLQKRSFRNLIALCERYNVDAVIGGLSPVPKAVLQAACDVVTISSNMHVNINGKVIPAVEPSRIPFYGFVKKLFYYYLKVRCNQIEQDFLAHFPHMHGKKYSLIFVFRLQSVGIANALIGQCGIVAHRQSLDLDDIESKNALRQFLSRLRTAPDVRMLVTWIHVFKFWRRESLVLKKFSPVFVCSSKDRAELLFKHKAANIRIVPNTIEIPKTSLSLVDSFEILLVGTMVYWPNVDAVLWFCNHILPKIKKKFFQPVNTWIVGENPTPPVRDLGRLQGVHVTGRVEDVRPYYERARFAVVPIRSGGGTRIKILEALALGRPVVSTTIGAEGLDLVPGRDILIADDPKAFAACCVELLTDLDRCDELARNGRKVVEELYSHEAGNRMLLEALE